MREQADRVEEALSRRIAETEEATRRLEDELKAVRILKKYIAKILFERKNNFVHLYQQLLTSIIGGSNFGFPASYRFFPGQ